MKYLLLTTALLFGRSALAQTAKPDQYCVLRVSIEHTDGRAKVELQSGSGELAASREQVEDAARVQALKTEVDALNYLGTHRWEVVGLTYVPGWGTRYCLRRHQP